MTSTTNTHRGSCSGPIHDRLGPINFGAVVSLPQTRSQAKWEESLRLSNAPYCTHQCLLGLRNGGKPDKDCPNASRHSATKWHRLSLTVVVAFIRAHANDSSKVIVQGQNLSGHVAAFYKVILLSHGYVLAAKGVPNEDFGLLHNEARIYHRLADMQGRYIPVHLGTITMGTAMTDQIIDGVRSDVKHMMLMSFAGFRLSDLDQSKLGFKDVHEEVRKLKNRLEARGLRQRDPYPRNVLYLDGHLMIIDVDRATMM